MADKATAPQRGEEMEEEWDVDAILDEAGIKDDDEPDGQQEPPEPPAEEAPAGEGGDAPAEEGPDVGGEPEGGPAAGAASGSGEEGAPEGEDALAPVPLTFKVDGEEVALEGSYIIPTEGGERMVVIPEKVFRGKMAANYLGSRGSFQRQLRAKELEIEEVRSARTAEEAQAKVLLTKLEELLEDPDALTQFLADFETQAPILRAQGETAAAKAEAEALRRGDLTPEQRVRQAEEQETQMATGLRGWIDQLATSQDEFKGLELDREGLFAVLSDPALRSSVFVVAEEDDPDMGVVAGRPAVDLGVVFNIMRREAALVRRFQEQAGAVVETARTNATKVNGGSKKVASPAGRAGGSPAPTPPAKGEPKTRAEWLESLDEDD